MQSIDIPQGELKTHVDENAGAFRIQLTGLRDRVQAVATTADTEADNAKKHLDTAISTGRRAEVVRALLRLSARSEFASLREDIDQARRNIGGPIDSSIVLGEQATRATTNYAAETYRTLPSWMRLPILGTALGGIGNVALAPIQGLLWLVQAKGLAGHVGTLRKYLLFGGMGLGAVAGATKGIIDMSNQGTVGALLPERGVFGFSPRDQLNAAAILDGDVRRGLEAGVQWPAPGNTITIASMPGLPVTEMRYQLSNSDGSTSTDLMHANALVDLSRTNTVDMTTQPYTRIVIRYKVRGETSFREPAFIKAKP